MTQERDHARVNKQEERGGGTHGQDLNKKVSPGGSEESLGRLPEMEDLNAWPPYTALLILEGAPIPQAGGANTRVKE